MLTGMLAASSGNVKCFGKNMISDMNGVTKKQLKDDLEYI